MLGNVFHKIVGNVGHTSSGVDQRESLLTEVEITIEVQPMVTHKPRHYLYAVL